MHTSSCTPEAGAEGAQTKRHETSPGIKPTNDGHAPPLVGLSWRSWHHLDTAQGWCLPGSWSTRKHIKRTEFYLRPPKISAVCGWVPRKGRRKNDETGPSLSTLTRREVPHFVAGRVTVTSGREPRGFPAYTLQALSYFAPGARLAFLGCYVA